MDQKLAALIVGSVLAFSAHAENLSIPIYRLDSGAPGIGLKLASKDPVGIPPLQLGLVMEPSGGYTAWLNLNSTVARHGGGSFMEFLTPNLDGKMVVGAAINAGLIDATPGHEGGDFELFMPCKGVFNRNGYNCGVALDGTIPAFYPTFSPDISLGTAQLPWGDAWITRLATPYHKCKDGSECMPILFGGLQRYVKVYAE